MSNRVFIAPSILAADFVRLADEIAAILAPEHGFRGAEEAGKKIAGVKIVSEQTGMPIGGGMGIVRQFAHFIDGLPCYIGYLWPLWDAKKQTFADKIAKTVVIDSLNGYQASMPDETSLILHVHELLQYLNIANRPSLGDGDNSYFGRVSIRCDTSISNPQLNRRQICG